MIVFIIDCDLLCRSCSRITCDSRGRSSQDVSINLSVFVCRSIIRHMGGNITHQLTHQLPLVCPLDLGAPAGLYDGSRKPTLAYKEEPPVLP